MVVNLFFAPILSYGPLDGAPVVAGFRRRHLHLEPEQLDSGEFMLVLEHPDYPGWVWVAKGDMPREIGEAKYLARVRRDEQGESRQGVP